MNLVSSSSWVCSLSSTAKFVQLVRLGKLVQLVKLGSLLGSLLAKLSLVKLGSLFLCCVSSEFVC